MQWWIRFSLYRLHSLPLYRLLQCSQILDTPCHWSTTLKNFICRIVSSTVHHPFFVFICQVIQWFFLRIVSRNWSQMTIFTSHCHIILILAECFLSERAISCPYIKVEGCSLRRLYKFSINWLWLIYVVRKGQMRCVDGVFFDEIG